VASPKSSDGSALEAIGIKPLEDKSEAILKGTVAQRLGDNETVPVILLTKFCYEGENIPDGLEMAAALNSYLSLIPTDSGMLSTVIYLIHLC